MDGFATMHIPELDQGIITTVNKTGQHATSFLCSWSRNHLSALVLSWRDQHTC
jgi:hypothetical protein